MLMGTLVPVLDFAREGKLRILATTAPQRLGILPEVPTVAEAGFPEIEMVYWNGIFVSSQVPRHLVQLLNTALVTSMRSPAVIAAAAKVPELQLAPSTPEAFGAVVRRDRERLGGIIREYGITIE